jgi:diaminopimelate decarboxylase
MTELIRPALYSAYHHITYASPPSSSSSSSSSVYDVVGPVCESGDFLGKERALPPPDASSRVVVFDAGAYGFSMSSNYNMRCRPGE